MTSDQGRPRQTPRRNGPGSSAVMSDVPIRAALDARLRRRAAPDSLIIHEFGVYAGMHRVDVATLGEQLCGFEIKSDGDTLKRLPEQVRAYGMLFDRMTLVVGERHHDAALKLIPPWWGVIRAQARPRSVTLVQERRGRLNRGVLPGALVSLLWRGQALALLESRGLARGLRGAGRTALWDALTEHLSVTELQVEARAAIRAQRAWLATNRPEQGRSYPG
ncbi:sce7726 family protein [Deinococcus soli (ex Cha et al. 2016)]|uniref:Sce7726 family protein n=2 Tax=Deinococcus soli (ex Cha et al. 2016) TaxID=1309411 RepID=A0AAE3XBR7_9DEIO|nr:sce7726 family protein [Deinococcus soli (ex Cha et al. 2016)]MDR6218880.1 hypothetical protein [Deinococcus soli (ex Cha et al. 2016)]MDR6328677.1 hypothetical protein [Deinococcus soli (ex Cha et al. 2016)]MDR6751836.1 hypothetical protein [Deinococcus soli (ex Cha et al. 2016)]